MVNSMKSGTDSDFEEYRSAFRRCMADVPFCTVQFLKKKGPATDSDVDAIAEIRTNRSKRVVLLLEAKPNGQPRNARHAVNHLLRAGSRFQNPYPVLVAPYVSPEAAEIVSRAGVGYLDLAGNGRLSFDRVYIRREGWPNRLGQRRELRSLYSPKAERALRVLLTEPKKIWRIDALAKTADVSLGQASNVKRLLEDREWICHDRKGSVLTKPATLLSEWAENYRFSRSTVHDFYTTDAPPQLEAKLATACAQLKIKYALTAFSAAARIAPMVRYQRASAYIAAEIEHVAEQMGLKRVSSGANVTLIAPYDAGVTEGAQIIDGVSIASAVQIYLDLRSSRGRGEEAAEAILNEVIKPTW